MTAPLARRVDMLSGDVAPTKYFEALSEADELVREVDGLRELQIRVDELTAEHDAWKRYATEAHNGRAEALRELASTRAERDDLIEQLRELDEAHQITVGLLATANAQLKRMRATR